MGFHFAVKSRICPKCGSRRVLRSRRRSFVKHIVCRLLCALPYRCDDCYARFFKYETD
jgi:hypothetical protein